MKVMDVLETIKGGARVMVTLPTREGYEKKFSLTDGTEVSASQFHSISRFLKPADSGLIPDCDPQSYEWAG